MDVMFGVKGSDLEEARHWVEKATGLLGEARESSHLGGDYYHFPPFDHSKSENVRLRLVSNKDLYDGEPVWDVPLEWELALSVEDTTPDSAALRGLEADTKHFKNLAKTLINLAESLAKPRNGMGKLRRGGSQTTLDRDLL